MFVIGADAIASAYFEVAATRRSGAQFAAMFLIPDRRANNAYDLGAQIVREGDYDRHRMVFDAISAGSLRIGEQPLAQLNAPDPAMRMALSDLSRLPDVLVVRSWAEAEALRALRGYDRPCVARWYPARQLGTWSVAPRRDVVVVWAPESIAERTALHTFALHDLHAEIVVISRGGTGLSSRAQYVDASSPDVPAILARALCVVDTSIDDPSWAQALAARGLSVVAASTSGAHEVADALAVYEPWSHKSIWSATLEALGRRSSVAREEPPPVATIERAIEESRPKRPEREPLASIIIPTYNRKADVARVLTSLKTQTYSNFEVLVVNDGGEPLAGIDDDPRVRIVDREVNVGVFGVLNFGLGLARGEYVQFLADDDELYPDHLMRLIEALERTGAAVAHSNILIRYETVRDGTFQTTGYNCSVFCMPLDRTEVYASSPVAGHAMMVRRSAFERAGKFDEQFILADQEIQIRLAEISDFVHVAHVTGEWLVRDTPDQMSKKKSKDVVGDLRRVFEQHPAAGRAYVAAVREQTLKNVASRPPGTVFPPVITLVLPKGDVQ